MAKDKKSKSTVKVPKKLRKLGKKAIKLAEQPVVSEIVAAALLSAAAALRGGETARRGARKVGADAGAAAADLGREANKLGDSLRKLALDMARRTLFENWDRPAAAAAPPKNRRSPRSRRSFEAVEAFEAAAKPPNATEAAKPPRARQEGQDQGFRRRLGAFQATDSREERPSGGSLRAQNLARYLIITGRLCWCDSEFVDSFHSWPGEAGSGTARIFPATGRCGTFCSRKGAVRGNIGRAADEARQHLAKADAGRDFGSARQARAL